MMARVLNWVDLMLPSKENPPLNYLKPVAQQTNSLSYLYIIILRYKDFEKLTSGFNLEFSI